MTITKMISPNYSGLRNKSCQELTVKPSKPIRPIHTKLDKLPASARGLNSESQAKHSESAKSRISRNSRGETVIPPISKHQYISESQHTLSEDDASNKMGRNLKNTHKNAVKTKYMLPKKPASNKTVVPHNTIPTVTSETVTITNEEASNDTNYEVTEAQPKIITLPIQGVSLPQENTNLTVSTKLKAAVKVDRLSITLDILSYQHDEVLKAAKDLCAVDKKGRHALHLRKQPNKHGSRYKQNYKIYNSNECIGFLSLDPLQSTIRFIRLDFNPSKIRRAGCKIVAQAIRCLVGSNATEVINGANITRLDIAVDLYGIDINSMLYFSAHTTDTCTWGKIYKCGKQVMYRLESQYIGALKSNLRIVAYDKRAEIIKDSKGKIVPKKSIVRNEFRLKPRQIKTKGSSSSCKCSVQFDNLESLGNPMQNLHIIGIPIPDKDDGHFTLLVHAAQHVGAQTALAMLKNSRKRAEYRKHLLGQAANYWKAEEYWARAIRAVKKTLASIS